MKMSREFVCCEKCFEILGRCNVRAAKAWMEVCACYMNHPGVFIVDHEVEELTILDQHGFVTTTDDLQNIRIKVNGYLTDYYGQHYFCIKDGQHA